MARIFNPNQRLSASFGAFMGISVLVVLNAVLNLARLPYGDVTPDDEHTLSQVTVDTIKRIDPSYPVKVDFYYTSDVAGLPREVKEAGNEVLRLLELYKQAAGPRLQINEYNPDPLSDDPEDKRIVELARVQGIERFEEYWNKNTSIVYCGLVIRRGPKTYPLDHIDQDIAEQLEFQITSGIYQCISPGSKKLGIVSGLDFRAKEVTTRKGEKQEMPEWSIYTKLKEEYDAEFLENPAEEIPSCDVLFVIQPRGLSEADYKAIDQHVLKGKGCLFCEAPFSFEELILLARDLQVIRSKYEALLQEEAKSISGQAEQEFEAALKKVPKAHNLWKSLNSMGAQNRQMAMQLQRQLQMQIQTNPELQKAFQKFREKQQRALRLSQGQGRPEPGGKAFELLQKLREKQTEELPPGRRINDKLFRKWGINLREKKLLFKPPSEGENPGLDQFRLSIGGPAGNPKSFAKDRLESKYLEALYPAFTGVLGRDTDSEDVAYSPLVRVGKQFSFFVPNPKAQIEDWFELKSFAGFLSTEPENPAKSRDRFEEWNKALDSRGDQLSGWQDIAVALERQFKSAFPNHKLKETKEEAKSRIVVVASVDMLELHPTTEEEKRRQRINHKFILKTLEHLSLPPEVASLTQVGTNRYRFHVLDRLVREAEKKAKKERKELAEYRKQKRAEAQRKYKEAKKKFPEQEAKLEIGGGLFSVPVKYVPEEQKRAKRAADRQLDAELAELKLKEKNRIERIEYNVANATRMKKKSVRALGTLLSPLLILLVGLLSFYLSSERKKREMRAPATVKQGEESA